MVGIFNVGTSFLNNINLNSVNNLQQTKSIFESASLASNTRSKQTLGVFDTKSFQLELNSVNNRISNINNLIDSYNYANNVLSAADDGLSSISTLLNQARDLSNGALETATSASANIQSYSFSTSELNNLTSIQNINGGGSTSGTGTGTGSGTTTSTATTSISLPQNSSLSDIGNQINNTLSGLGLASGLSSSIQEDINNFIASSEVEATEFNNTLNSFINNSNVAEQAVEFATSISEEFAGNETLSNLIKNLISDPSNKDGLLSNIDNLAGSKKEAKKIENAINKLFKLDQDTAINTLKLASTFAEDGQVLEDIKQATTLASQGSASEAILNEVESLNELGSKSREALNLISELSTNQTGLQKQLSSAISELSESTDFLNNLENSSDFSNLVNQDAGITSFADNTSTTNPNPVTSFDINEDSIASDISAQIIDTLKSTSYNNNLTTDLDLDFNVTTTVVNDNETNGNNDDGGGDETNGSSVNTGNTFSIKAGNSPTAIFEIKAGQTAEELVEQTNQFSFLSASIEDGRISIKSTNGGDLITEDINGEALDALGIGTGTISATEQEISESDITNRENKFNDIIDKIKEEIAGSDYKYKNLLNGASLDVFLNDLTDSQYNIRTNKLSVSRLGITDADFNGTKSIEKSIEAIDKAITKVEEFQKRVGSNKDLVSSSKQLQEDLISELDDQKDGFKEKIEILNDKTAFEAARNASRELANQAIQLGSFNSGPALLQLL